MEEYRFIKLKGRETLHRENCKFVLDAKREKTYFTFKDDLKKLRFCKTCCNDLVDKKFYVVLDLEMCNVPRNSCYKNSQEIIQIGAVILDESFSVVTEFSTYIRPKYGKMDRRISKLTGIKSDQLKHAPLLEEGLEMFMDWMSHFYVERIYAWSESDYYQFKYEIKHKNIESPEAEWLLRKENWIDYQEIFGQRIHATQDIALEEALMLSEIYFQGHAHNGLDDAINTAFLIEKLEMNPDYVVRERIQPKTDVEELTFTLGDLLRRAVG